MEGSYILPWECLDCFFDDDCSLEQTSSSKRLCKPTGLEDRTQPAKLRPFHLQLEEILTCGNVSASSTDDPY